MAALNRLKPGAVGQYFECEGFEGAVVEVNASTCAHCASITEFATMRGMMEHVEVCRSCMKLICLNCYGKPCVPFERRAELIEQEAYLRAQMERASWGCYR